MTDANKNRSIEQRLQAIEDRLEILNLVAAHPPGADSASHDFAESFWLADGTVDMAGQPRGYESMIGVLNTPGFRVLRLSANRWELQRTPDGWRIKSRTMRGMDNPASRELLKKTTTGVAA